jgi:hypothetical protein
VPQPQTAIGIDGAHASAWSIAQKHKSRGQFIKQAFSNSNLSGSHDVTVGMKGFGVRVNWLDPLRLSPGRLYTMAWNK